MLVAVRAYSFDFELEAGDSSGDFVFEEIDAVNVEMDDLASLLAGEVAVAFLLGSVYSAPPATIHVQVTCFGRVFEVAIHSGYAEFFVDFLSFSVQLLRVKEVRQFLSSFL